MEHGESGGDAAPRTPDGPPPAREQLPLPRRTRQAHIEPQLRAPRQPGTGTPFAAFASPRSDADPEDADRPGRTDRAAEFYAGARRGRGRRRSTGRHRGGSVFSPDSVPPPTRPKDT